MKALSVTIGTPYSRAFPALPPCESGSAAMRSLVRLVRPPTTSPRPSASRSISRHRALLRPVRHRVAADADPDLPHSGPAFPHRSAPAARSLPVGD